MVRLAALITPPKVYRGVSGIDARTELPHRITSRVHLVCLQIGGVGDRVPRTPTISDAGFADQRGRENLPVLQDEHMTVVDRVLPDSRPVRDRRRRAYRGNAFEGGVRELTENRSEDGEMVIDFQRSHTGRITPRRLKDVVVVAARDGAIGEVRRRENVQQRRQPSSSARTPVPCCPEKLAIVRRIFDGDQRIVHVRCLRKIALPERRRHCH